jgi:hypothetical protein
MKRSLYLFSILLFLGIFAVHFTVYIAHADDATTVKSSKSNASERQVQPVPEPVEATTVKSSKSNSDLRQVQPVPEPVEVNPCASTRCQSGYHCVPLSQVGFCAKDQAENVTITCNGIIATMHGTCADYAHQLAIHPKCTCTNL